MKKLMIATSMLALALTIVASNNAEAKSKKMSKKAATAECKADPSTSEGAALKDCVKAKRH